MVYDSVMQNVQPTAVPPPAYPIASVDNALTLLELLRDRATLRGADAAAALGTSRSTAHRLLAMLEYRGFARQDPATREYSAGPALVAAGLAALAGMDIRGLARPVLERLTAEVGETAHLVVLDGGSVVFVESIETSRALRVGSRLGRVMPAPCTAAGKAILAQLPPAELRRLYPGRRLERLTDRSHATLAALEPELEEIRARGYATNYGQSEEDVAAVAVAISGAQRARAAISVSTPMTRLGAADVPRIADAATRAAAEVARRSFETR
jgi:IclR family transcriptional regulator, acetate operon repressor